MVNITKTKRNFIGLHTLFAIISAGLGAVILHIALPGHYFGGYPFIPVYFYLFGLFSIYMFDACRLHAPQKMLLLYLAIKMVISIILVLIYCIAVREEAKAFLLTFISFYLIYLIFETWFFFSFEVNQKRKKQNKKKNETVA